VAAGAVLLGEQVSAARWTGAVLIAAGAALTSLTPPTHGEPER
jgi:drug/metabolite transporter (DMT)-like permease